MTSLRHAAEREEVMADSTADRVTPNSKSQREGGRRSYSQTQLDLSAGRCSDRPAHIAAAIDLLERQACNCFHPKVTPCLRCELLDLLRT